MKNLLKITVLGLAFSGLAACSSAQKEEDSVMADLAQSESTMESTEDVMETTEPTMTENNFVDSEEDTSSLGTGSSGLGH